MGPAKNRGFVRRLKWVLYVGVFFFLCGLTLFLALTWNLPSVQSLQNFRPPIATEVFSDDYIKIGEFFKERRIFLPLQRTPPLLVKAFIASEDAEFFHHQGISLTGIARAAMKNIAAGGVRQGGSTITQQVAKALLLSPERSLTRKAREAVLAYKMERFLSKEQILELYLNQVYLGHGAYGVAAAAQVYFDKEVADLTLSEIALLAGLTKAPSRDNPFSNFDRAVGRKHYVLSRMLTEEFLSQEEHNEAKQQELVVAARPDVNLAHAPYFVEHVRRYLTEKYGDDAVLGGGLQVYTTLRAADAQSARQALRHGLEGLDERRGYRGPIQNLPEIEWEGFLAKEEKNLVARTLLQEEAYKALVTRVDDEKGVVFIRLGNRGGAIALETLRWARSPNPEKDWEDDKVEQPSDALSAGDVVWVSPIDFSLLKEPGFDENTLAFRLIQKPLVQGALVSIDPRSGAIRAMVGGYDYQDSEFNRAVQARRQPGSAFKPITYTAALEHGYTAASVLLDSPIVFDDPTTDLSWKPKNFGGQFRGEIGFRTCLIKSINVPTVKIIQDIGVGTVIAYARRLGITSPLARDFSLALGSSAIAPIELVQAYAVFASGGRKVLPVAVRKVVDRDGKVLERNLLEDPLFDFSEQAQVFYKRQQEALSFAKAVEVKKTRSGELPPEFALPPQTAYIMTHLLKEVVQLGTGRRASAIGRPAAGKTGTTNENHDAWFVGFTPSLVTAVWVGFDEAQPLGRKEVGGSTASPIWLSFMKEALKNEPVLDFPVPDGVVFAQIDPATGNLATEKTENALFEAFLEGTAPTQASEEVATQKATADFFLKE